MHLSWIIVVDRYLHILLACYLFGFCYILFDGNGFALLMRSLLNQLLVKLLKFNGKVDIKETALML